MQTARKLTQAEAEILLVEQVAKYRRDPLGYVRFAFQWGVGELAGHPGPRKWQAKALDEIGKALRSNHKLGVWEAIQQATASGHGVGKALSSEVFIPSPSGMVRHGDIKPGDLVIGGDGFATRVTQVHPFEDVPMYHVAFDDGTSCDCSSGHLWSVRGRSERRTGTMSWRTLDAVEIARLGVKRPNGAGEARQWEVPIQGMAQFEPKAVDVHPYVCGVWLSDGTHGKPQIAKRNQAVRSKIGSCGYDFSESADGGTIRLLGVAEHFHDGVFALGSHERFIPDEYKFNSVERRMELFSGLCDGDGEANHTGSIGYSSTSRRLIDDVAWLARSLGCKVTEMAPKTGWYRDDAGEVVEGRACYRLTINCPFNPFSHSVRKEAYKPSESRYLTRWIDSIERIENAPSAQCLTVEAEDGLYQANDFIVTHNSALVGMVVMWAMSFPDCRGIVTANTDTQLRTKTWPEVAKWHRLAINGHWFNLEATKIEAKDPLHAKNWRIDIIPWSENNTEAFAGLHNEGKRILVLFDEASAIADKIWEVTSGTLTDDKTEIIWLVFGNPTRQTGAFRNCFGKLKHRWNHSNIDAREVEGTNRAQIDKEVEDYGEDSDRVRVRVRGEFPLQSDYQLISQALVENARRAVVRFDHHQPVVAGLDLARSGSCETVLAFRCGRDARSIEWCYWREKDSVILAGKISHAVEELRKKRIAVHTIFADGGGLGGPIIDMLRHSGYPVREILNGTPAIESNKYGNKGSECWGRMAAWLPGAAIPDDPELESQLVSRDFSWHKNTHVLILEPKDKMISEGLESPDRADALALTFAEFIVPRADIAVDQGAGRCRSELDDERPVDDSDYARMLAFDRLRNGR